jgi:beta-lactamase superfamily II metal-dependent hydrolase
MKSNKFISVINVLPLLLIFVACSASSTTQPTELSLSNAVEMSPGPAEVVSTAVMPEMVTATIEKPTAYSLPTAESSQVVQPTLPTDGGSYQVHFVDVGQGDSELIITPNKKTILIDGGEQGTGIVSYLKSVGVNQIDVMVNTHPHSDHFGGLVDIFNSGMPVKEVITNGRAANTELFNQFLDDIDKSKAEYVEAQRGDKFSVDGLDFYVVSPTKDYTSDDVNNTSLVIWMKYDGVSFLFTGDQAFDAENNLLASGINIKADFLKVGHHGSATSTSDAFIQAVAPKVAIYSAGVNNQFNLPSPETIARLSAYVPAIYGTDKNGTIIVTVNPEGYKITLGRGFPVAGTTATQTGQQVIPTATQSALVGRNLSLSILSVTNPASKGTQATLTAQTIPGANCTITVYYKSGASKASGLEPQVADSSGFVKWTWKVATITTAGTWKIVVTANDGKNTVTQETNFEVK